MSEVVVVDSGVANLASVTTGFRRLGASVTITDDPDLIRSGHRIVLPGVGAFGTGMAALRAANLDEAVRDVVTARRPLLAICLGLQLLTEASDESPGIPGIGIISGVCRRLPSNVRVPHLGWNRVSPTPQCRMISEGDAAFANSFCLIQPPLGWAVATTAHGTSFLSALERDRVLACQFHPELSGAWGTTLLRRWLTDTPVTTLDATQTNGGGGLIRRLVPCLDVRDGRVVKGIKFQGLRDAGDPAERAALYEQQGADEIVVLDVAASPRAQDNQVATVERVRAAIRIPLTVGGGVRALRDARRLLNAGADKVSVNTAAVRRPEILAELADAFGTQCTVLAIDARRAGTSWEVLVVGGQETTSRDAIAWAREGVERGAGEILLTSWDRDGTRAGCDLALVRAVSEAVSVPVIASGGIGSREDAAQAIEAGAEAVLAASIFHDNDDTVADIKADLRARGIRVRL